MNRVRFISVILLLTLSSTVLACAWDYDTIKMERSRFPSTLELITGKFLRHSPEFYQWRIENRLTRLKSEPGNVSLLDDLAVAYDKMNQHGKAIETAKQTEKQFPNRYETAANLGTFYFHSGDLNQGVPHIENALRINPEAHFGRERIQLLLVEYLIEQQEAGRKTLPLATIEGDVNDESDGLQISIRQAFTGYLRGRNVDLPREIQKPIDGILGMMKFGSHKSPVLLEALGLLLSFDQAPERDAKHLAARAFLKASYEVKDESAIKSYRAMARNALSMQTTRRDSMQQIKLEQVETNFKKELEEADNWYRKLHESELSWIKNGIDPEKEFDKLYSSEPAHSGMEAVDLPTYDEKLTWRLRYSVIAFICFAFSVAIVGCIVLLKKRWRKTDGR